MMKVVDLEAICKTAKKHGIKVFTDNTFATPVFQKPLELGADVVVHSTTKFLNGHSDVVGGVACTNDDEIAEKLFFLAKLYWRSLRTLGRMAGSSWYQTLPLRMRQHDASGREIAAWLESLSDVEKVYYPGLSLAPQHELAARQMSDSAE